MFTRRRKARSPCAHGSVLNGQVAEHGAPWPVFAQLVELFRNRVVCARLAGDQAFLRRLADAAGPPAKRRPGKRAKRKSPALTITAVALVAYRDVYAVLGRSPRPGELRAKVEAALGCAVSDRAWRGTLRVLTPLF